MCIFVNAITFQRQKMHTNSNACLSKKAKAWASDTFLTLEDRTFFTGPFCFVDFADNLGPPLSVPIVGGSSESYNKEAFQ